MISSRYSRKHSSTRRRHPAVIWVGAMPKWESTSQKKAIGGSRRCRRYEGGMAAADRQHVQMISRDRYYVRYGSRTRAAAGVGENGLGPERRLEDLQTLKY